jgi:spore maturation protein CgeB
MFEPGVEAEFFTSAEELLDKISWYLEHEDERKSIALKGYERVKKEHSWKLRVASLIRMVNSTL